MQFVLALALRYYETTEMDASSLLTKASEYLPADRVDLIGQRMSLLPGLIKGNSGDLANLMWSTPYMRL